MFNIIKKSNDNNPETTSASFQEMGNLQKENALYKNAFAEIAKISDEIAMGNLSSRISSDHFGNLAPTLDTLNKGIGLMDQFIQQTINIHENTAKGNFTEQLNEDKNPGIYNQSAKIINATQAYMADQEKNRKDNMIAIADNLEREVKIAINIVQQSSEAMRGKSDDMLTNFTKMTKQANNVLSLSENVTQNVNSCVNSVSDMSGSAQHIRTEINSSNETMLRSEQEIDQTRNVISNLSSAAEEIGDIASLIKDISARTNLLALNATIEAARAGEFGKGFSVVANEVKVLATQTRDATDRVNTQIATMQDMVKETINAVENIGTVIRESSEKSKSIVISAEQQITITEEINRNIKSMAETTRSSSSSVSEMAQKANDSAQTAQEVTKEVHEVQEATNQLSEKIKDIISKLRDHKAFNRREAKRHMIVNSPDCKINHNGKIFSGKMNDISISGTSIAMEASVQKDDYILFTAGKIPMEIRSLVIANKDKEVRLKFNSYQEDFVSEVLKVENSINE